MRKRWMRGLKRMMEARDVFTTINETTRQIVASYWRL